MPSRTLEKKELDLIEKALKNNWPLRPIKNLLFHNIDFQKGTSLNDEEHILKSIEDFDKFPEGATGVALIPHYIPKFICLDFDTKDKVLQKKIIQTLKKDFKKEELFLRKGSNEKLGQIWFYCDNPPSVSSLKDLDIITHSKRCDAIGQYKKEATNYRWPFKNIWSSKPTDLPKISRTLVDEILNLHVDTETEFDDSPEVKGSRYDAMRDRVHAKIMQGEAPVDVYDEMIMSNLLLDISADRPLTAESDLARAISGSVNKFLLGDRFIRKPQENPVQAFSDTFPKVEDGSFIDLLFEATKRNQYTDAKKMAFFSALSATSWLLNFSTRFMGVAPNLMILYIAKSGSGKSTSARLLKKIERLCPQVSASFSGDGIKTSEGFFNSFERAPNMMYYIDEYSKFLSTKGGQNSATRGITQDICRYYSDYDDQDLAKVSLKHENYGVCFGPKFNGLMFTTPEVKKEFSKDDFLGGMGRRTFMVIDENMYFDKLDRDYQKHFFSESETQKIKSFLNTFVFSKESEVSLRPYVEEDISCFTIKKIKASGAKGEDSYYSTALKFDILNELKPSEEVLLYLKRGLIIESNRLKLQAGKSGKSLSATIINSFSEFTKKLAIIHSLAGKKEPSLIVEMDSIKWGEDMFKFYMMDSLTADIGEMLDTEKNDEYILESSQKFYDKLLVEKISLFTYSSKVCTTFFRGKRKKVRSEVLNHLRLNNKIELQNEDASKRSKTYKVIKGD